ncbi:hypothetical protein TWF730_003630 [Orbilia blumenaviensis]|uniref:BTB domain-containing protein n=1 Tax=Orbilia blumenaviensis TaxID=1796055 RepID=A0AAV9U666_9PEZI
MSSGSPQCECTEFQESEAPSEQTESEKSVLMRILEKPKFSDITVYVGKPKKSFHLHKDIISLTSRYFKSICTKNKTELNIRTINPDIFKSIVSWQYEGGLILTPESCKTIVPLYKAVEFLGMPKLKADIFRQLAIFYQTGLCGLSVGDKTDLLKKFMTLCRDFEPEDLEMLIKCVEGVVIHYRFTPDTILLGLEDESFPSMFVAALIGARESLGHWNYCDTCFG